jgi:hypothetical protein
VLALSCLFQLREYVQQQAQQQTLLQAPIPQYNHAASTIRLPTLRRVPASTSLSVSAAAAAAASASASASASATARYPIEPASLGDSAFMTATGLPHAHIELPFPSQLPKWPDSPRPNFVYGDNMPQYSISNPGLTFSATASIPLGFNINSSIDPTISGLHDQLARMVDESTANDVDSQEDSDSDEEVE